MFNKGKNWIFQGSICIYDVCYLLAFPKLPCFPKISKIPKIPKWKDCSNGYHYLNFYTGAVCQFFVNWPISYLYSSVAFKKKEKKKSVRLKTQKGNLNKRKDTVKKNKRERKSHVSLVLNFVPLLNSLKIKQSWFKMMYGRVYISKTFFLNPLYPLWAKK